MYIETIPNRSSPPAVLLRKCFRENGKPKKVTLANLSELSPRVIERMRRALRDEPDDIPACRNQGMLHILEALPHGAVHAVLGTLRKIGLDKMIAAQSSWQRNLVLAMIAGRILFPTSKLGTIRRWKDCTLAQELEVADADEDELYAALDWLLQRQDAIEAKLARRHLGEGSAVLYDVSSSFYHGAHCPLAEFGHNPDSHRDKNGLPIIVYGVLANREGCPVAVQVYAGNTADPKTVMDQVDKLRVNFGLQRVVLTADRGCITTTNIKVLREYPKIGWIGALRSEGIRKLMDQKALQLSLFDKQNLAEITSPDYPGERLMACLNPALAQRRRNKRDELLIATEKELTKIAGQVDRARLAAAKKKSSATTRKSPPMTDAAIGLKVGKAANHYKVAKHFIINIHDGRFSFTRHVQSIEQEQALDGIYIIRASETAKDWSAEDVVRGYKKLAFAEGAFRCLKGVDLKVRPIWLRKKDHVKAHIFLCVLAYYVEWHIQGAWKELLFADEELDRTRDTRDPVLPPEPSESVLAKKKMHTTADGLPVQSFASLLEAMGTLTRNRCVMRLQENTAKAHTRKTKATEPVAKTAEAMKENVEEATFTVISDATPLQERALKLLGLYPVR